MDFEYHVCPLADAQRLMREHWPSHVITALGKRDIFPSQGTHHLVLEFDDSEVADPGDRWVAPTQEQIEQAMAFAKTLAEGDRLLVHCKAGDSRSPAILLGALVQAGVPAEQAIENILTIRPTAIFNRLIVDHLDAIFGLSGDLSELVDRFYDRFRIPGIKLPRRGRPL